MNLEVVKEGFELTDEEVETLSWLVEIKQSAAQTTEEFDRQWSQKYKQSSLNVQNAFRELLPDMAEQKYQEKVGVVIAKFGLNEEEVEKLDMLLNYRGSNFESVFDESPDKVQLALNEFLGSQGEL